MTEKYKKKYIAFKTLSIVFTILPILIYTIVGFCSGTIGQKVTLGLCLILVLMMVLLNIIIKHRIRSALWIMLIGIYVCCNNIVPLLIVMAITTMLDEFVFEHLCKKYKEKYIINKEIDAR